MCRQIDQVEFLETPAYYCPYYSRSEKHIDSGFLESGGQNGEVKRHREDTNQRFSSSEKTTKKFFTSVKKRTKLYKYKLQVIQPSQKHVTHVFTKDTTRLEV